jgi:hypothetical protein
MDCTKETMDNVTISDSHNKPIGCGASGAYAPGPEEKAEGLQLITN